MWQEGCLVQTCKAGTVVKSLAEECLKLIEQQIEDVLDKNKDQNVDDVLEGNSTGKGLFLKFHCKSIFLRYKSFENFAYNSVDSNLKKPCNQVN